MRPRAPRAIADAWHKRRSGRSRTERPAEQRRSWHRQERGSAAIRAARSLTRGSPHQPVHERVAVRGQAIARQALTAIGDRSVTTHLLARRLGVSITTVFAVEPDPATSKRRSVGPDAVITGVIVAIEYAIVISLLIVASIVLVRTVVDFLNQWSAFPSTVVGAIDGILVVIILLDIVHTVFGHLRSWAFTVRPFLVIGILAGVRDILSTSAHLTLSPNLSVSDFNDTLVTLGVGVGVVVFLLLGLLILHFSGHSEETG